MSEEITVELVRRLAEAANLQIPEEDLEPVAVALRSYRSAFRPLESLDLTGVDPIVTMDPRWTR
ncbi:MAG: hypothetical protein M3072_01420 [Candidatus Dormibacteraeota bacterium]|jgi:Asp-tRNA(Asn)/Glu-tRNA(Gln) amidotransferase C subunit|nr:hypothetical protein [Candidatus Dormibacteraeota bacterium]